MYERMLAVLPPQLVKAFRQQLVYANYTGDAQRLIARVFIAGILLSIVGSVVLFLLLGASLLLSGPVVFLLFVGGFYLKLNLDAESRAREVERILPDALQLISSNIKSGLTTERSLLASARPEFGALETELKRISTKVMSGTPVELAIMELPNRINSRLLQQTMWLLSKGITAGGQITDLLMQLAENIRDNLALQEEIKANISTYVILIFFSAAIGGPALYGVSTFIVEIMDKQRATIPQGSMGGIVGGPAAGIAAGMMSGPATKIEPEFVIFFAMVSIFISTIFSAAVMGIINQGKEKAGIKYLPFMLAVSFVVFFVLRYLMRDMFGSVFF